LIGEEEVPNRKAEIKDQAAIGDQA